MGIKFKLNAFTGDLDMVLNQEEIGSSLTYIKVDTTNHRIEFYVNGVLKQRWRT